MVPESWFVWAILTVAMVITIIVAERKARRHRELTSEYYGNQRVSTYTSRDDETASFFHETAEQVRIGEDKYDRRTLAELASECPACKGDHAGSCELLDQYERDLAEDKVLTGTIVAVEDIPEPAPETSTLFIPSAQSFTWEVEHEWHRKTDGSWQAPWALLDSLPEEDWLRELLTEPVRALVSA